jgi:histidine triad (HIT) family protein
MATVFSKILSGEIPSYKILEDDSFLAFLDISPLQKGHSLVIPKKETNFIFDIEDKELGELMCFAKKCAQMIRKAIPCEKIGVAVLGLEVAHAHIHLIPINSIDDMSFSNLRLSLSSEELLEIRNGIVNQF